MEAAGIIRHSAWRLVTEQNYEKYENNPVITADNVPEGGSRIDFRDPKIWQEEDGTFYAVASNANAEGNSSILLYKSQDALHWEFCSVY